jgi:hypothetical protein
MPSAIEFPFSDDEALPTIPIALSYADCSISAKKYQAELGVEERF